ncbi:hypothetical protein [Actinophytocola gossypii]|uniref:Uncharacterized protein n=1 Tax=Actinophytocola gossypii TaxID=2812003 RepID=A0ABT2J2P6_9PSEU|nr:hypothetical protein [Actinophytocola gossypii]MCT2582078.1 hypothetical protein [Actinophytocola gossypii]
MSSNLTRRALLAGASAAGLALALPGTATAQRLGYAAFRVVRVRPGEPARPEITLPDGYEIVPGERYSVASRAEFYTFVRGPVTDGIDVRVSWPRVPVRAVVHQETRLGLRRHRDGVAFTLPITEPSADANQPTLQVWSHPDISPGVHFRIEHNDPDRVAGPWTTVEWPAGQVRSVVHQLIAAHVICRDSGLAAVAAAKGHRFVLMGFETNNTLHADNPPHWHISYNSGPDFGAKTHNPHFWLDEQGRTFYNGMDVTGHGRSKHYVGDPAPVHDFVGDANGGRGDLVVTFTIREDGGLTIAPATGPAYAIAAGRDGTLLDEVTVLRANRPWLRITTRDLVKPGLLLVRIDGLENRHESRREVLRYDPLTGVLQ